MPFVVGLTGGIGSGKSAAADEFARLGATVVDTDQIAHQLTSPRGAAMPRIRRRFGKEFVEQSGALDRRRMRELVFARPSARRQLEAILHPMIRAESRRRIRAAKGPYVVHVVPLLVESKRANRVDRVLVVDCPIRLQIARVARRGLDKNQIRKIMRSQASRAERLSAADDVIDNSGSIARLRQQVRALHRRYLERRGTETGT